MTLGELAGAIGTLGTLALTIWGLVGKGREGIQARMSTLEKEKREAEERADAAEEELSRVQRHKESLLEFLQDIVGDSYALDWIKKRAEALLKRMAP